jgi:hypothetical protein
MFVIVFPSDTLWIPIEYHGGDYKNVRTFFAI